MSVDGSEYENEDEVDRDDAGAVKMGDPVKYSTAMGRHVNSVSLNRSIEAAYKLSIYTLGSCILPCCVSFKDFCCFLSIMLAILFTFSFLNAYE